MSPEVISWFTHTVARVYLFKLGLGVVEVGSLHNLRELRVQANTEVEHAAINLHLCSQEVDVLVTAETDQQTDRQDR